METSSSMQWYYLDTSGTEFGPFSGKWMRTWFDEGRFPGQDLQVRAQEWTTHKRLSEIWTGDQSKYFVAELPDGGDVKGDSRKSRSRSRKRSRSRRRRRRRSPSVENGGRYVTAPAQPSMALAVPGPGGYADYGGAYPMAQQGMPGMPPGYNPYGPPGMPPPMMGWPPYGMPPQMPAPGYAPPGYGLPPPGYGPPPPGYGLPPPAYGAPGFAPPGPPGYGPPGYGPIQGNGAGTGNGAKKSGGGGGGGGATKSDREGGVPYKTLLCKFFKENGVCERGDACTFAHGAIEITGFKTKECKFFTETGECTRGDLCSFAHGSDQLVKKNSGGAK